MRIFFFEWNLSGTEAWIDASGYLRQKDYIADKDGYRILKSKTVFVGVSRPIKVSTAACVIRLIEIIAWDCLIFFFLGRTLSSMDESIRNSWSRQRHHQHPYFLCQVYDQIQMRLTTITAIQRVDHPYWCDTMPNRSMAVTRWTGAMYRWQHIGQHFIQAPHHHHCHHRQRQHQQFYLRSVAVQPYHIFQVR